MNVWLPSTRNSKWLEVPIRTAHSPANMWLHIAVISADWQKLSDFGQGNSMYSVPGVLAIHVDAGDTVLKAQASVGLAAVQRETFANPADSDDWVMAVDGAAPAIGTFDGPAQISLPIALARQGRCFPSALGISVDLLVLRVGALPETPPSYGHVSDAARAPLLRDRAPLVSDMSRRSGTSGAGFSSHSASSVLSMPSHTSQSSYQPTHRVSQDASSKGLIHRAQDSSADEGTEGMPPKAKRRSRQS